MDKIVQSIFKDDRNIFKKIFDGNDEMSKHYIAGSYVYKHLIRGEPVYDINVVTSDGKQFIEKMRKYNCHPPISNLFHDNYVLQCIVDKSIVNIDLSSENTFKKDGI